MIKPTPPAEIIGELKGGIVEKQLAIMLSEVAAGVVEINKVGKITLALSFKRIADSHQINVTCKISHVTPTPTGDKSENTSSESVFYVGRGGRMTTFPENAADFLEQSTQAQGA